MYIIPGRGWGPAKGGGVSSGPFPGLSSSGTYGLVAFICGIGAFLLGVLALVGWVSGMHTLASVRPHYIPMAPSTAVAFLLLGAILSACSGTPLQGGKRLLSAGISALVSAYGLIKFGVLWNGAELPLDAFLYPVPGMLGGIPTGRMSPATGMMFFLAGTGFCLLVLREGKGGREKLIGDISGSLGTLIATAGLMFLLGYVYGAPLLYGGGIIPVALPTAVAFLTLGAGLVAATGEEFFPLRFLTGSTARARLLRAFLPLTVFIVIAQDALHGIFPGFFSAHSALAAAISAVIFAAAAGVVVSRVATAVGRAMDRVEEQRKRTEEEWLRLATAVEQSAEAIVITDPEGTIQYANPAFERITGYGREEVVGRTPRILKSGKHGEEFYRELWSAIKRGDTWAGTFINKRKDGTLYEEEAIISPVRDSSGALMNFVAVKRDVTEERRMEERIRLGQKLEAVGRLAGGIAHDFNNLLTAITGYSELVLNRIPGDDPIRRHIQEIQNVSGRAAGLTRQLLAFSRKQVLQPSVIDLNAVVADIDRMLRRIIGEDIDLYTVLDPGLGRAKADKGQIEQVIMNLAVNARDAMPAGGKLTIETSNAVLDEVYARAHVSVRPGDYVMLALSDTGSGMDPETMSHIFEPFFTTKERGKGTGLGLSTVYGIVKQSGGNIWVYSEQGRGTTFKVYLPRVEEEAAAPSPVAVSPNRSLGSETILLVEDEEAVRTLVQEILERYGYMVLPARDGHGALLVGERHAGKIHLMLCDVVMPGMSGVELSRKIGNTRPEMKILYMSGYTDNAIVHHGVLDPGTAFIEKPFTPDALARKVRAVLDSGSR
jgi:PAS domain S-box-containing protein